MIQLRFSNVVGVQSAYLFTAIERFILRIETVSPYASLLCFLNNEGLAIDVPIGFTMTIPSSQGDNLVNAFQKRVYAMSHSIAHLLVHQNQTMLCISPASFGLTTPMNRSLQSSPCSSLASSEEVSRSDEKTRAR